MKYILLQHWTGKLRELEELSRNNMKAYAEYCGADYELVMGNVVHKGLAVQSQKIVMLDEKYDDYDVVVMVDLDQFTRKGMTANIFTEEKGIGRHFGIQPKLVQKLARQHPLLGDPKYPYWGGSCYRLERDMRKRLRKHLDIKEAMQFNNTFHDEGIMHRLAVHEKLSTENVYFSDDRWQKGSYEKGLEFANFIHIRPRISQDSRLERPKIETYKVLKQRGIL